MQADWQEQLSLLRQKIDATDKQILELLLQRAALAHAVGQLKQNDAEPVFYRPERERMILESISSQREMPFSKVQVQNIFREIISACRALETPLRVACLGPTGTFSEAAVYQQFGRSVEVELALGIPEVFRAVERGQAHYGVVPIENSSEGMINQSLDCLAQSNLFICAEVFLKIEQNLLSKTPDLRQIERIYSHSQSLAQCRRWISENLPQAQVVAVTSNAQAVQKAAIEENSAAIAGKFAAEKYAVPILASNIADRSDNTTRFVVIANQEVAACGKDKTSLLLSAANRPGALFAILEPIGRFGINMSKIESRPNPQRVWEYLFFIDLDGHKTDAHMQELFAEIENRANFLRILGSYPKGI